MTNDQRPRLVVRDTEIARVGGDGINVRGSINVELDGNRMEDIAGNAVTISEAADPADHWYKRPIGLIGLTVAGGLLLAAATVAIKHYFPALGF